MNPMKFKVNYVWMIEVWSFRSKQFIPCIGESFYTRNDAYISRVRYMKANPQCVYRVAKYVSVHKA